MSDEGLREKLAAIRGIERLSDDSMKALLELVRGREAAAFEEAVSKACVLLCDVCAKAGPDSALIVKGKWMHGLPPVTQPCGAAAIRKLALSPPAAGVEKEKR